MAIGKVKWFNNAKGYGFILTGADGEGEDLFAHYSSIEMEGYKTLRAGQTVEFDIQEGPKGLHAVDIRPAAGEEEDDEVAAAPEEQAEMIETEDNRGNIDTSAAAKASERVAEPH